MEPTLLQLFMILGGMLNLLLSGGTLYKLIDFAREYGKLQRTVEQHGEEINRLRDRL